MTVPALALVAQLVQPGTASVQQLSLAFPKVGGVLYGTSVPSAE